MNGEAQAAIALAGDELDIFGQQPLLRIYTQISLCYALRNGVSHDAIIKTLTEGLERLAASFPWVASQVINDAGVIRFGPLESVPRLVVKDYTQDPSKPTMEALRQADFPASMLHESILAPRMTLPGGPNEGPNDPAPVFLVQATFVVGGLLLTFVAHHGTMDMTGQGQFIDLLHKACRNEPFTSEELSSGNLPRLNLVPLLEDSYDPTPDVAHQLVKPKSPAQPATGDSTAGHNKTKPAPDPKVTWAYFSFSPSALAALKSSASGSITNPPGYISTDDALTAFIWQSVARARTPRLSTSNVTHMTRAVDVRRYLPVPATYPGLMQNLTYHQAPLGDLLAAPVGLLASQLRTAVDPLTSNLVHATRALATYISRTEDKTAVSFAAQIDGTKDIMLSSWSKVDCYALDFGLGLGAPKKVRRPGFVPVEGLMYLMPKAVDGEIALLISLREEDMERLRVDEEFAKYAKYVG